MDTQILTACVQRKITEGIERANHLINLVPGDRLEWRPTLESQATTLPATLSHLLGHLLDSIAGFCAALSAAFPTELNDFSQLRELRVNHLCSPQEAITRIALYAECVRRGFEVCTDRALTQKVRTVFVPEGQELLTILLGNFEHLTNHKYQLFFYLKLLGLPVGSADLYELRGIGPADLAK